MKTSKIKIYSANINKEIVLDMLKKLPDKKLSALQNALERNQWLTSVKNLESCELIVYKEGFYLTLNGTRCSFSVFAYDNDGELSIQDKKPHDSKLHVLYRDYFHMNENDFDFIKEDRR